MRRSFFLWLLITALVSIAIACRGSAEGRDTTEPVSTGTAGVEATANPATQPPTGPTQIPSPASTATAVAPQVPVFSESRLPTRPVRFELTAPENTPLDESVYISIYPVDNGYVQEHIEMSPHGANTYLAEIDLPSNGLVRYAYSRWDQVECCGAAEITRESLFTGEPVMYRSLIAHDPGPSTGAGAMLVRDVVPQWNDLETDFSETEVTGRILDFETLEPLMDVDVTVAGVHVATDFNGRFTVPGIVPGKHRVVTTSATGVYLPVQREIEVSQNGHELTTDILMRRARLVPVEFEVHLPEFTPADAGVFLAGNLRQIGGRPGFPTNSPAVPSGISMPQMQRDGNIARLTVDLPAGAYVEYFYTLGSDVAAEVANYDRKYRNFIVGDFASQRVDGVVAWGNQDWPLITLRVQVPSNTPNDQQVYLRNGPTYRMNQLSPTEWVTVVGSHPPGSEYQFAFYLGDHSPGMGGSPEADSAGERFIVVPDESTEYSIKISKWQHLPDPDARDADGGLTVKFRLSVPPETPENAAVVLTGNRPAVGTDGTVMSQVPGNPWLYEADVNFDHDGTMRYRYTLAESGISSEEFTVSTDFHGQEINDYIASWDGAVEPRDGWVSGLFLPDFFSESMIPASGAAFEAGDEVNGEWVAISSVWSFGQILPEPYLESRPVRIWTVLTPIDDIREQARIAREHGKKIFLSPQMNPEIHPDWQTQTVNAGSVEWWEQWLEQAEAQWMWNAIVAEEIGAEMLMLPGYVFHVFPPPGFFHDENYVPIFDLKVQEMIGNVREVYSGKIMISGGQTSYDFPGLADYVGVTTYDIGVPELPAEASVEELRDYYSGRFAEKVDPLWERWGKPVMMYTIHAPARAREGDEFGQLFQAAAHEAMFQEVEQRPFMIGAWTWAFDYVGVWQFDSDGVRNRAAGAVLAKWYERFGG